MSPEQRTKGFSLLKLRITPINLSKIIGEFFHVYNVGNVEFDIPFPQSDIVFRTNERDINYGTWQHHLLVLRHLAQGDRHH